MCWVWSIYQEGFFPETQHLTLFEPGHLPETVLVPQLTTSVLMQAPPPPLHGPLYVESDFVVFVVVVFVSVFVSVFFFPLVTQHLKLLPPGHFPLKVSPLH